MKFVIDPYRGIGKLKFGMSRDDVRKSLDTAHEEIVRNEFSQSPFDSFIMAGLQVNYDPAISQYHLSKTRSLRTPNV